MANQQISIADGKGQYLRIVPLSVGEPDPAPFRWVESEVSVRAGKFDATVPVSLLLGDLERLESQLADLHKALSGTAKFDTLEGQMEFALTGNGRGGVELKGRVSDSVGQEFSNTLDFTILLDQTFLPPVLESLRQFLRENA